MRYRPPLRFRCLGHVTRAVWQRLCTKMADQASKPADSVVSDPTATISVPDLLTLLRDQAVAASQREEQAARREERLTAMLEEMRSLRPMGPAGSTASAGATLNEQVTGQRPSAGSRPPHETVGPGPQLHEGISLQEFGTWETRLRAHARRAKWDLLSIEDQTAAVLALLDDYWTRTFQHGLDIELPNTYSNVIAAFQQHLRRQRSVVLDRRDFFRRQQEAGESFDDYLIALRGLAQYCDFCAHCSDEQFRDGLVTGVRDRTLGRVCWLSVISRWIRLSNCVGPARVPAPTPPPSAPVWCSPCRRIVAAAVRAAQARRSIAAGVGPAVTTRAVTALVTAAHLRRVTVVPTARGPVMSMMTVHAAERSLATAAKNVTAVGAAVTSTEECARRDTRLAGHVAPAAILLVCVRAVTVAFAVLQGEARRRRGTAAAPSGPLSPMFAC